MKISFFNELNEATDTLVFPLFKGQAIKDALADLDTKTDGLIATHYEENKQFKCKLGDVLVVRLPKSTGHRYAVLLGLGEDEKMSRDGAETAGGKLYKTLKHLGAEHIGVMMEQGLNDSDLPMDALIAHLAMGVNLSAYEFDKYKDKRDADEDEKGVEAIDFISSQAESASNAYIVLDAMAQGVFFARDLVNEPPNVLYPESYAEMVKEKLKPLGVQVEVLDDKKMVKMGMGALMAVGQGSARPARMVIMRWNGGSPDQKPLGFVGKGVTFDTGGISIKPAAQMDLMKMDMGGSAAVCGLMYSLALRNAPVNVVGAIGLVENMPSDNAYRPADIVKAYNGKTIEILNTDAEGRLVLCDTLAYVQEQHDPEIVIDLATLTGAIMVALGTEYTGVFCNNDELWAKMDASGKHSGEKLWRMPLGDNFSEEMKSKVADYRNLGTVARYGGASTAAAFLEFFIDKDRPWAHMDIAGTAWAHKDKPTGPMGGTGAGVRALHQLIVDHYE
ncbi:MAG: leucyl aminopeptidase [Alphaproteobacteria bacterium]|nr:leucyl aminopeptidase [Alphaproteobacteria bacterium]|tara:strand:- start:1688 stop:3196 length:1509 start_codon:yes stop_codon:yes gene_type:complete